MLFLLNRKCILCQHYNVSDQRVCYQCFSKLKIYTSKFCCFNTYCYCGFDSYIPFVYENNIRKLMLKFKYSKEKYISDIFIQFFMKVFSLEIFNNKILISIPMTKYKLFTRSYNQSVELCKSIQKLVTCSVNHFVFKKTINTTQKGSNNISRKINAGSIVLDQYEDIINRDVIIVDDIVGSGSTFFRCYDLLKDICRSVSFVAIAKS